MTEQLTVSLSLLYTDKIFYTHFPHSSQQSQQVYCNDIHLTNKDMKAQRDKLHLTCIASKNCNSFINQILVPQKWHPTLVKGSWKKLETKPWFQWILYFPEIFRWYLLSCCPDFSLSSISRGPSKMLQQLKYPCPTVLDTVSKLMIR